MLGGLTQFLAWLSANPILGVIGAIQVILDVAMVIFVFVADGKALYMPMKRFAQARRKKQICIVGDVDQFESLKTDITATGIVKEENIKLIDNNHLDEIRAAWTVVICAEKYEDKNIIRILEMKPPHCPALVYAPNRRLSGEAYRACDMHNHVAICNFRGRLVDQLILSLLTCSFERNKS